STRCVGIPYARAIHRAVRHRQATTATAAARKAVCPTIRAVSKCRDSAPIHCATRKTGLSITSGNRHPSASHRQRTRSRTARGTRCVPIPTWPSGNRLRPQVRLEHVLVLGDRFHDPERLLRRAAERTFPGSAVELVV